MDIPTLVREYIRGKRDVPGSMAMTNAKLFWKLERELSQTYMLTWK